MPASGLSQTVLQQIARAIGSIRYGTVQVTVHDARVVQIETSEKIRIAPSHDLAGSQAQAPSDAHP